VLVGQPVAVIEKPSTAVLGVVRFETNRNLGGMGHERYRSEAAAVGVKPTAAVARRLLATGQVEAVHIYLNVITVDLKKGCTSEGLKEIVEDLYTYYRPGVVVPSDEELMGVMPGDTAAAAAPAAAAGDAGGGNPLLAKVPPHLIERSKAARDKWFAKQGG
jgi:hypothetical protein